MIHFSVLSPAEVTSRRSALTAWLHEHLEAFGDDPEAIARALDYAVSPAEGKGGLVALAEEQGQIRGCTVVNNTGMSGYIPEHQLVYIAVHKKSRGQGLGRRLLQFTVDRCQGAMALHVEYDNPARFLYEKLGFTSRYAEMRRDSGA